MELLGKLLSRDQRRVLEEHLPIHPFAPSFTGVDDEVFVQPGTIFCVLLCVEIFHVRLGATLLEIDEEKVDVKAFRATQPADAELMTVRLRLVKQVPLILVPRHAVLRVEILCCRVLLLDDADVKHIESLSIRQLLVRAILEQELHRVDPTLHGGIHDWCPTFIGSGVDITAVLQ